MAAWNWKKAVTPLADKIVYASQAYVGIKSTVNDLSSSVITFTNPPAGVRDEALLLALRALRPESAEGLRLIRVGGDGDGGYVMHDDFGVPSALSIGVGRDISWDVEVAARGVKVHSFDHTVKGLPAPAPHVEFHRIGLGAGRDCIPWPEMVRVAGPQGDVIAKIDIEGAEWQALENQDLSRCAQLILELHELRRLLDSPQRIALLRRIHATLAPVHLHANNYDSLFRADKYWFCDTVEISYVRRDLLANWHPAPRMNIELDRPCDPRVADMDLSGLLTL